jgi:hypothetical protein
MIREVIKLFDAFSRGREVYAVGSTAGCNSEFTVWRKYSKTILNYMKRSCRLANCLRSEISWQRTTDSRAYHTISRT